MVPPHHQYNKAEVLAGKQNTIAQPTAHSITCKLIFSKAETTAVAMCTK